MLDLHLRRLAGLRARAVFLEVDEGNQPARQLYQRAGFHEVGRRPVERLPRPRDRCLGTTDPLGDRRLWLQQGLGDLSRRETPDCPQRQRNGGARAEGAMTAQEQQCERVILGDDRFARYRRRPRTGQRLAPTPCRVAVM